MRNSWYLKNRTTKEISLGDMPNLPSIAPNKIVDLLKFYDQDAIVNSSSIKKLFNENKIQITKIEDGIKTTISSITQLTQADKQASDNTLYQPLSEKDEPEGYAGLDEDGNLAVNQILIRSETASDLSAIVLEEGELAYTTDTKVIYVGDGSTAGGNSVAGGAVITSLSSASSPATVTLLSAMDNIVTITDTRAVNSRFAITLPSVGGVSDVSNFGKKLTVLHKRGASNNTGLRIDFGSSYWEYKKGDGTILNGLGAYVDVNYYSLYLEIRCVPMTSSGYPGWFVIASNLTQANFQTISDSGA